MALLYKKSVDQLVARIAARQFGVFARHQIPEVHRNQIQSRIRAGLWDSPARGVFRVKGSSRTKDQAMLIASLAWGEDTWISHRSAAAVFNVTSVRFDSIELTVPPFRRRRDAPGIVYRNALRNEDKAKWGPIPVTSPLRTVLDLAAVLERRQVALAIDDFLRRGYLNLQRLDRRLGEDGRGFPNVNMVRDLVATRLGESVTESDFETELYEVIDSAGLPRPTRQVKVSAKGRDARLDFAYPSLRVGVEADSRRWHLSPEDWEAHLARSNWITAEDWLVIHVTWRQLTQRPQEVAEAIRSALQLRGSRA
jgi:very-short-patch-repair endonuclease